MRFPAPWAADFGADAEIKIGDSPVMLADETPEQGQKSLRTIGGSPISLMVYVEDVNDASRRQSPQAPRSPGRSRTSSTAIALAASRTRSATSGISPRTSRTSSRPRLRAASRR